MMGRLQGKVAAITGASRGQGEATARLFACEAASIVLIDRLDQDWQVVARYIGAFALFVSGDVTEEESWARIVAEAERTFGRIHVWVNNAAMTDHHPLQDLTRARLDQGLAINLVGPMLGMRAVIPGMLASGGGAIVNISSVNGLRGASKAIAMEFGGRGIRVNSVHPGAICTPMLDPDGTLDGGALCRMLGIAVGRVGEPDEVARVTLFLASSDASYVNGAEIAVDGGWSAGIIVPEQVDPATQVSN